MKARVAGLTSTFQSHEHTFCTVLCVMSIKHFYLLLVPYFFHLTLFLIQKAIYIFVNVLCPFYLKSGDETVSPPGRVETICYPIYCMVSGTAA